jgi:hypothetical protein
MNALQGPSIIQGEFIRLTCTTSATNFIVGQVYKISFLGTTNWTAIGDTASTPAVGDTFTATGAGTGTGQAQQIYTFCNAAGPITVSGITFTGLNSLLSLGQINREIKASSSDLAISLTGIDQANVNILLSTSIKGAKVEVWRGFFDSNNQIATIGIQQQFFARYQGIVSNMSITESFDENIRERVVTCSISCASFRSILQNRVGGVKTSSVVWKTFYPSDTSMDRVSSISATYFDFGKPPSRPTIATPENNSVIGEDPSIAQSRASG